MAAQALNPGLDEKTAAGIARRRRLEEERKARIFNPRARTIGVDTAALDAQIEERRQREAEEAARERAFALQQERAARELARLDAEAEAQRRAVAVDVERFREHNQRFETRKEFDLNDPDALLRSQPARVTDSGGVGGGTRALGDGGELGPSSLQVFEGEDLDERERKRLQQQQLLKWNAEQMAARDRRRREEEEAERLYELRQLEMAQRGQEIAAAEKATRRAMDANTRAYNARLAAAQREADQRRLIEETNERLEEINNNLHSDFLTENPAVARNSALGAHRVIPTEFKGLTPDEIRAIEEERSRQVDEAAARRRAEEDEARRWELQDEANRQYAVRLAAHQEAERKAMDEAVARDNHALASEQRTRQEYINRELYTNVPGEAFWDQFQTTTR